MRKIKILLILLTISSLLLSSCLYAGAETITDPTEVTQPVPQPTEATTQAINKLDLEENKVLTDVLSPFMFDSLAGSSDFPFSFSCVDDVYDLFKSNFSTYNPAIYQRFFGCYIDGVLIFYFIHNDAVFVASGANYSVDFATLRLSYDCNSDSFSKTTLVPGNPFSSVRFAFRNFNVMLGDSVIYEDNIASFFDALTTPTEPPTEPETQSEDEVILLRTQVNRLDMVVTILLFALGTSVAAFVVILLYKFMRLFF